MRVTMERRMPPPSISCISPEVFLLFLYGHIIPHDFVDNLYRALTNAGIRVWLDREYLQKRYPGAMISTAINTGIDEQGLLDPQLLEAIEQSEIYIPILCTGFGSSPRCITKLSLMMTKSHRVLPILYDLPPGHLQSLAIGDAGVTLSNVATIKGLTVQRSSWMDEAQSVKLALGEVLRSLGRSRNLIFVADNAVGIDNSVEAIMGLLDVDANAVRMVGIHGMGGIGKTTLANIIYDRISNQFEGCCFMKNVRDKSSQHDGLKQVKRLIVADILKHEPHDHSAHIDDIVSYHLQNHLRHKKVLVVLDDVDDDKQINELVGNLEWFGLGSRIIVTTRKIDVLPKVETTYVYEVKKLNRHDAFLLFCKHAFLFDSAPPNLVAESRAIVSATGGLPLSIETIGSYLFAKADGVWKQALNRLRTEPDIQNRLKISYNALDYKQKEMFLDIACFFIGLDARIAIHMWKACGFFSESGIEILSLMSVVKVGDENELWLHDQFRDLGREIVRQENVDDPKQRSRLWGKDALTLLDQNMGTSKVLAIRLDYEVGSKQVVLSGNNFSCLTSLRYLDLGSAILGGNFWGCPLTLRWLGWHGHTAFNIPSGLNLTNIVVLDFSKSVINGTWSGWGSLQVAKYLQVLNLTGCHNLTRTPDFSSFTALKRLILRDCLQLDSIDPSIGVLRMLLFLDLRNCPRLNNVPNELGSLGELTELLIDESSISEVPSLVGTKKLETFSAKSCRNLRRIPDSLMVLEKLQKIWLDNCESLTDIPPTIKHLESLKELSLPHTKVMNFHVPLHMWTNLKVLNINHCPIRKLPASLWYLRKLEVLNASGCLNLEGEIPSELEHLISLRTLRLDHTNISSLPTTIGLLSYLNTLDLEGCMRLQMLPDLPASLINLKVTLTSSLIVPNLHDLIHLKHLEFQRCNSSFVSKHPKTDIPSSSTHSHSRFEYDVFLSFRGPDTRTSFTDILYRRLMEVGIRAFMDNEDLRPGEEIGLDLLQAIHQSKISIPIISKGYASSRWCLIEATKMVECMETRSQQIIPIFFDISPTEVRHQTGSYAESFTQHLQSNKYDTHIIQEWRGALTKIGKLKGWDLTSSSTRHQGEVIEEVVSEVLKQLQRPYLDVSENLVGIEERVGEVMRLLDIGKNDVRMLGIWGMGGIGKTTIAKLVYNHVSNNFDYCSFISDIRGISMSNGLVSLQRQLVSDVSRKKCKKISNVDEGKFLLKSRLCNRKVLVLLDDVDQIEQLSNLVPDLHLFGPGSRVIVTTRDRDILHKYKVEWVYEVREMHQHNAFVLFCKHAFRQDSQIIPDFASLSWEIVTATGGLPLAIEIIGSYLSFQGRDVWKEALDKLKAEPNIQTILRISYDALSHQQQEIFLDIACLFIGMDGRILIHMWKACRFSTPASAIQDLCMRSLIKTKDDHKLWMHDQLRDLGREIVRQKSHYILGNQSRFWYRKDVVEVLEEEKGTGDVKGIHLDSNLDSKEYILRGKKIKKLPNVLFLGLSDVNLAGNFHGCLTNLRWLSWDGNNDNLLISRRPRRWWSIFMGRQPNLRLKQQLVIFDISKAKIGDNWNGWTMIKEAVKMEVLSLSSCHQLTRTPNFSSFSHMKRLILKNCQGLVIVDESIGDLKFLEFLDMRSCSSLVKLPEEIGHLTELTELLIDECPIQELPDVLQGMSKLRNLSAKSCRLLTKIPTSVEFLVNLTSLLLDHCTSLVDVPSSIGNLQSLRELSLSFTGVVSLPDSIGNLSNLQVLNIDQCPIRNWPNSLVKLGKLEVLSASRCRILIGDISSELENMTSLRVLRLDRTSLTSIPESIIRLSRLHTLDLKECTKLEKLPNLPSSLVILKVTCKSSVIVPNLPELINLKQLEILLCGGLRRVPRDIDNFLEIDKLVITIR